MKTLKLFLLTIVIIASYSLTAQVAVSNDGSSADGSAMLEVKSTSKGLLPPRMTESQMEAITDPTEGLMVFCTDCVPKSIKIYNGSYWLNSSGIPELEADEIFNPVTGKIWKDRNLGASQVATSSNDAAAFGDLYQWGRLTDGHESRTSGTTTATSSTDDPGHSNFIVRSSSPYDWRNPRNNNLWQGENGINNPCPEGFRIPTLAEWVAERASWGSDNIAGAYASLKLTMGGTRWCMDGLVQAAGIEGDYWSSTINGESAQFIYIHAGGAGILHHYRSNGFLVRCIKD